MEEQKVLIDETFETWRGNLEQIDGTPQRFVDSLVFLQTQHLQKELFNFV